jgi:hypothetical protein
MRLVALDEGPDIPVDNAMIVVGRHPSCDTRPDSLRVSRRHCCITPVGGELEIRDLGSTNGIRINGQRVETGRLRPGDELSIAHIRYKLDGGHGQALTLADPVGLERSAGDGHHSPLLGPPVPAGRPPIDNPLAAAVRDLLLSVKADKCRIQVIVQMRPEAAGPEEDPQSQGHDSCQPALAR